MCVDCTPANLVTAAFDWPLPSLQDLRHRTKGSAWFTRIDLSDAFFRISVPQRFRGLTAFKVGNQAYQFKRMPFGLKTAPSVFQRYMDWGLSEHANYAFWYIDDVLIHAPTQSELRHKEKAIRARLLEMGSAINEAKGESGRRGLLFAGLWVFKDGIGPNAKKLSEAMALAVPTTKAEAQSALGLVSYLRDHLPLLGHFTAMLYPDKQGLRLSEEQYAAEWGKLHRHLQAATTLRHWTNGKDADLYTDASGYALGAVLMQDGKIVGLASRKLTPAETRYSATDREHLGLVYAARKFRIFLHQSSSTTRVWSDHAALITRNPSDMTPRQARWHQIVTHWMPNVCHVKGKDNPADFISRWTCGTILGAVHV